MMGKKLPAYVADIWNAGGPPTPLILNGWVFSDDADKRERWRETLRWAEKYDLLHFTRVENRDQYFPCGCSQGSGMYFENEYRDYTDNIIKKYGLLDYVTLANFDKVYDKISDEEKKSLISSLIKEIEIFPCDEAELPLKSILFNFPIYKDGEDACDFLWDKSTHVSTWPEFGQLMSDGPSQILRLRKHVNDFF